MRAHINNPRPAPERKVQVTVTASEARVLKFLSMRDITIPEALEAEGFFNSKSNPSREEVEEVMHELMTVLSSVLPH